MAARLPDNSPDTVHALRVDLKDVQPAIYRELLVRSSVTLAKLHEVLQIAFGWSDSHLHEFEVGDLRYGPAAPDGDPEVEDERAPRLRDVLRRAGAKLTYVYDFGDSWTHIVKAVRIVALAPGPRMPAATCVGGARAAPPEDCGGAWGYMDLCAALRDPAHPRREELAELHDSKLDAERFDRDLVSRRLARLR